MNWKSSKFEQSIRISGIRRLAEAGLRHSEELLEMQKEEGNVKIIVIDPVGREEPREIPVKQGIHIPGTSPAVGNGRRVKRIWTGCRP